MRSIGWIETLMPFGVAVSAALHGSILGVVLLGWPILTFMTDNDWFSSDRYVRIDVVLYSEKEDPEVAQGKGVVSFETETTGKGQAQSSGRAFGPLASHSQVPLTRPNSVARRKSSPDAPSKAAETAKSETTSLAPSETAMTEQTAAAEARETEAAKAGAKSAETDAADGEAQKSSDSASGQKPSAPPSKRADRTNSPTQGQVAKGQEAAQAQAVQSEALAPDRPKGREDATVGATVEGSDAAPADGKTPHPTDTNDPARDGAETGLAEAEADEGETESASDGAAAAGSRSAEASLTSERAVAGALSGTQDAASDTRAENPSKITVVEYLAETRESVSESQDRSTPERSDRPSEETRTGDGGRAPVPAEDGRPSAAGNAATSETAARPETRLIRVAAVLDLTPSSSPAFGAPDIRTPLPLSTAGESLASQTGTAATEPARKMQEPSEAREESSASAAPAEIEMASAAAGSPGGNPVPPKSTPQLVQAGPSQIRDIPLRMLVQTMPGLDAQLVQAIDNPETTPEQPATARRKKVIDRIAAAAERGYVHAQYGMARRYLLGQVVPREPAAGAEWLQQAAEQGHVPSQLLLGYLAARGYGRERNMADAMMWWTLAADAGDPNAASAVRITEPTLDSEDLLEARRNINSWRAAFGQVEETISAGGDNTPTSAPLQEAVAAGDLPEVRSVLARGEDAEGRDIDGRTALINASWRGDPNITETLLEVGADPDILDHEGKSGLIWAASNGNLSVTALLVDAGAELDIQDDQGLTALMRASWNGHTRVVEALLKAGADTNLEDNNGLTALDHATREKYDDIIALLKAGTN
jgi:hypothetical protein